jgi:ribosomal protein L37AE/L43A
MIRGVIAPDLQRRRTTGTTVRTTIAPQDFQDLVQLADEECTSISALLRRLVAPPGGRGTTAAAAAAAPEEEEAGQATRRSFRAQCRKCRKVVRRTSRKARTWTCPHCQTVNVGPGLAEELAQPPADQPRRRRSAAAGAKVDPPAAGPAPVRRKSTRAAAAPAAHGAAGDPLPAGHAAPETGGGPAAAASTPGRRNLLDRILGHGADDEGEE